MKYKAKPIARLAIRELVEKKFRARGAVFFHAVILFTGTALLLWNLPVFWESRFVNWYPGFRDAIMLYGVLTVSFALHAIQYHFKHGGGYLEYEAESAARINRDLRRFGLEEAEEREALIELEQEGKLKNRRLLWQHASLFLGLSATMILMQWSEVIRYSWNDGYAYLGLLYFIGAWGIALVAHALRYHFTFASKSEKRQARIDAEVTREMAALGLSSGASARRRRLAVEQNRNADAFNATAIEGRARHRRA